ncbi:MAG TPA: hypothetical protein ENN33_11170, partial [Ignavibacteria bacterium]|nr:hypothetical protein [Ignavibacteria bacterium]
MKKLKNILAIFMTLTALNSYAQSQELMAEFSLFFEYHKNNDFTSALPHGWNVIHENPEPFIRYKIFTRMEEALFFMHDSIATTDEEKLQIADTTLFLYEKAIQFEADKKAYFLARKAFVIENWTNRPVEDAISAYEEALIADPNLDTFYQDRLGVLYARESTDENGYKL